jgi:NAD(P)-dependent dehydrogenase (short-subunit alcohol dehydrogenase family)
MAEIPLTGKVVAITGGARGIGLETAKLLLAGGAKVGAGDLEPEALESAFENLSGTTATFELDVTDRESFVEFLEGVEETLGPIDILINNAGVMAMNPFHEEGDEVSERMLKVNLLGPMYGMKLAIPGMLERGRGHIINVVSTAGRFGIPGEVMYSASKFGAFGMTEAAAAEYANTPLKITAICPVVVKTDLTLGVKQTTRGVPTLEPHDVAESIVRAIHKPKVTVYVPSNVKLTYALATLMPLPVRRLVEKFTRADRVMVDIDNDARADYYSRMFKSKTPR